MSWIMILINFLLTNLLIVYPLKTPENQSFQGV